MQINKSKLAGYLLVTIGVCVISVTSYIHFGSLSKQTREFQKHTVAQDEQLNSNLTGDMKIQEIKSNRSVIEIPFLKIKAPITEGLGDNLAYSVGHFEKTPKLSSKGNICLAGHSSSIYSCVFNDLEKVEMGDDIIVYDENGKQYNYTVISARKISPDSVNVLNDFKDNRLTIITCTERGTMRWCVVAKVLSTEEKTKFYSGAIKKRLQEANDVFKEYKSSLNEVLLGVNPVPQSSTTEHEIKFDSVSVTDGYSKDLLRKTQKNENTANGDSKYNLKD